MKTYLFACFALLAVKSYGQDTIYLKNPSFEDDSKCCAPPAGWDNRAPGRFEESPTDIQPGTFSCTLRAKDGDTYVGMVVRDNNTWESIGQDLNGILKKDSSYSFSLYLALSRRYFSYSRLTNQAVNYATPAILRIWGYNNTTRKEELLAQTGPVTHAKWNQWQQYDFIFKPAYQNCEGIRLEAYYYTTTIKPYNGNLLVDNCSAIVQIKN